MSVNIDTDYIDVFILQNNKKIGNLTNSEPYYYRIISKDIGVKEEFQEINFSLNDNIEIELKIKFKNKFSEINPSFRDTLTFFTRPKLKIKKNKKPI